MTFTVTCLTSSIPEGGENEAYLVRKLNLKNEEPEECEELYVHLKAAVLAQDMIQRVSRVWNELLNTEMSVKSTRKGCLCEPTVLTHDYSTVRRVYPAAANLKVKVEMLTKI